MASRPVFLPIVKGDPFSIVKSMEVEFTWSPGLSIAQKQKNIQAIADAACQLHISPILEVSTKSPVDMGRALSAFALKHTLASGEDISIEAAFQSAKVFESGGPFKDLQKASPREARRDPRLSSSGKLKGFELDGHFWPTHLGTAFYDWIYCSSLFRMSNAISPIGTYEGFTDIEFNPKKSLNCQARSCALYVALSRSGRLADLMANPSSFQSLYTVSHSHLKTGDLFD